MSGSLDKVSNCYECKHRRNIPGDSHSSCDHPSALLDIGGITNTLRIQANRHGIRMGWFAWPFNYDPLWLEHCDGFEEAGK